MGRVISCYDPGSLDAEDSGFASVATGARIFLNSAKVIPLVMGEWHSSNTLSEEITSSLSEDKLPHVIVFYTVSN